MKFFWGDLNSLKKLFFWQLSFAVNCFRECLELKLNMKMHPKWERFAQVTAVGNTQGRICGHLCDWLYDHRSCS